MSSNAPNTQPSITDFETIEVRLGGSRHRVIKISEWLWITKDNGYYKVVRSDIGQPILNVRYSFFEDAARFAQWANDNYSEFFPIWSSMPQADIFALCRWTVKNGVEIYKIIEMLKEIGKKEAIDSQNEAWQQLTFLTIS